MKLISGMPRNVVKAERTVRFADWKALHKSERPFLYSKATKCKKLPLSHHQ